MYWLIVSRGFCNALYRPTFQGRHAAACPAVFIFSFSLISLPPVWFVLFCFLSVSVGQIITGGQQITTRKRQQNRQNKWEAAKILILIRMGNEGKNSCKCTTIQGSLSYLQTEKRKKKLLTHRTIWWHRSVLWSFLSLRVKISPELQQEVVKETNGGHVAGIGGLRASQGVGEVPLSLEVNL